MDGTLLNSNHEVSEKNKAALKECVEKGVHVAIATGRIYTSARVYAKHLEILTPIIACNGAMIRNMKTDEVLYESHIKKEDCLKVVEIAKKNQIYFHYYSGDTFYTEELEYSSVFYSEWNKTLNEEDQIKIQLVEDAYAHIKNSKEPIYKIQMISEDPEMLMKMRKEVEKISSIECCKSWHNNIEIMNKGVSKASAIKELEKLLNVQQEEIICFGDNENDISMLNYAGMGVAMDNAEDIVKQNADYITATNNEDGVEKALRKFVL
ncbi:HAD family phosphatase [Lutibacter sp. B2]|nr:HAD family phosphatase [Lutibacter sp. B2]